MTGSSSPLVDWHEEETPVKLSKEMERQAGLLVAGQSTYQLLSQQLLIFKSSQNYFSFLRRRITVFLCHSNGTSSAFSIGFISIQNYFISKEIFLGRFSNTDF